MEFCDELGQILGYFIPRSGLDHAYEWAKQTFTDAEIRQAHDEPGGRTTSEILARLAAE